MLQPLMLEKKGDMIGSFHGRGSHVLVQTLLSRVDPLKRGTICYCVNFTRMRATIEVVHHFFFFLRFPQVWELKRPPPKTEFGEKCNCHRNKKPHGTIIIAKINGAYLQRFWVKEPRHPETIFFLTKRCYYLYRSTRPSTTVVLRTSA